MNLLSTIQSIRPKYQDIQSRWTILFFWHWILPQAQQLPAIYKFLPTSCGAKFEFGLQIKAFISFHKNSVFLNYFCAVFITKMMNLSSISCLTNQFSSLKSPFIGKTISNFQLEDGNRAPVPGFGKRVCYLLVHSGPFFCICAPYIMCARIYL